MTTLVALGAITAITLRQIRRLRRLLLADPVDQHDRSWCACDCGDDPGPCSSRLGLLDIQRDCTLTAGHDGLHEHGGTRWTDGLAADAA